MAPKQVLRRARALDMASHLRGVADADEAEELGLEDARDDSLLLVEWPERLPDAWWADALWLTLTIEADGSRGLTARVPTAWKDRWPLQATA